jgi:hypothetical protein
VNAPLLVLCLARPELVDDRPGWVADAVRLEPLEADETLELVDETAALESDARWRIVELAGGQPPLRAAAADVRRRIGARRSRQVRCPRRSRPCSRAASDGWMRASAPRCSARPSSGASSRAAPSPRSRRPISRWTHTCSRSRAAASSVPLPEVERGDDAYRFHHVLLRDAAYATLTKDQRADLHERVAAWLDRDGPGDDALVGYHLEQAAQLREAPAVAEAAGGRLGDAGYRAGARGDTRAALGLLRRAVDLLPAGERRGELLWELAIALWIAGRAGEAETALAEGTADADARGDRRLAARWTVHRALVDISRGSAAPADVLAAATDALIVLEAANDTRGQGRAWNAIVSARIYRCEMALMAEAAANAEACALAIGFSTAASIGAQAAALNHGPTPAREAVSACLGLLERARDRADESNVLAALAALHAQLGRARRRSTVCRRPARRTTKPGCASRARRRGPTRRSTSIDWPGAWTRPPRSGAGASTPCWRWPTRRTRRRVPSSSQTCTSTWARRPRRRRWRSSPSVTRPSTTSSSASCSDASRRGWPREPATTRVPSRWHGGPSATPR